MLPSIWGDDVASTRVYERRDGNRGAYPYLYVRPLDGGRSERQPGGSRGTNGLPGPVGLDLYGRRLSFVWNYSTGEPSEGDIAGTTEVRLDTVGGDNEVLSQADFDDQPASYIGPTGSAGRIFYGFQRVQPRGEATPTSVTSLLLRHRITSGERSLEDDVPSFLIDTTTDGRQTILGLREDAFGFGGATSTLQRSTSVDYDD